MRVPDLDHMIQVEEDHARRICIHCGERQLMHSIEYHQNDTHYPGGRVLWRCNGCDHTTFESIADARS